MGSKNCVFFLFLEESHFVLFVVLPEKEVGSGEAYCMGRAACLKAKSSFLYIKKEPTGVHISFSLDCSSLICFYLQHYQFFLPK